MGTKRLIQQIQLQNFLSFGPDSAPVELLPLNVLIGANASGKTNFIEAFRLLNAAPTDLGGSLRQGGGIKEFLWKGTDKPPTASIETVISPLDESPNLEHLLSFTSGWNDFQVTEEIIRPASGTGKLLEDQYYYSYQGNQRAQLKQFNNPPVGVETTSPHSQVNEVHIRPDRSVLSEFKDPGRMPFLASISELYSKILFFTEINFSRRGPVRNPQNAGGPTNRLWEDASNLGLILNNLLPDHLAQITDRLKLVYNSIRLIKTNIEGGYVQLYLFENGFTSPIPAIRLSEGTLRFLCLLTLLLHPEPPPVVCIEEPEQGLHPDVIASVAELLVEASQRTQLIITTHSDILVSALARSDAATSVLVCERDSTGTQIQRLANERLSNWLAKYSLGELWLMGELGGTRW
jgi:predicted ATPase